MKSNGRPKYHNTYALFHLALWGVALAIIFSSCAKVSNPVGESPTGPPLLQQRSHPHTP